MQIIVALVVVLFAVVSHASSPRDVRNLSLTHSEVCCYFLAGLLPEGEHSLRTAQANSTYQYLATHRWSNTAILHPSCIITPSSAEEVSVAIKFLVSNQCKFAVKSGGHMAVPGYNSIDDGVSIDLSKLNQAYLAPDRSYVSLGAGITWGAAYDIFSSQNIAFPGGLCGTTGVGGVSLGGGESYFMAKVGWVVDNVINYQIVLASGKIVNANQTSNQDLYRALKGGSSNFGIVTRVDVVSFDFGDFWAGVMTVPAWANNTRTTLLGITNFTRSNAVEEGLQVLFMYSGATRLIDMGMANIASTQQPESLRSLYEMQPKLQYTLGTHRLATAVHEINYVQPAGYREDGGTITFVNDEATILAIHNFTSVLYETMRQQVPDATLFFSYIPQPRVVENFSARRGGNSLGLENTTSDQVVMFFNPRWSNATDDNAMYASTRTWVEGVEEITNALGTSFQFRYINFCAKFQKPFCSYGQHNVNFLRTTARKYDPEGVFQTLLPGGFKVTTPCPREGL